MLLPIGKESPELSVDVSIWLPELSVAAGGIQVTTAVALPLSVFTLWSLGHPPMTGFSLSVQANVKNDSQ